MSWFSLTTLPLRHADWTQKDEQSQRQLSLQLRKQNNMQTDATLEHIWWASYGNARWHSRICWFHSDVPSESKRLHGSIQLVTNHQFLITWTTPSLQVPTSHALTPARLWFERRAFDQESWTEFDHQLDGPFSCVCIPWRQQQRYQ